MFIHDLLQNHTAFEKNVKEQNNDRINRKEENYELKDEIQINIKH